MFDRFGEFDSAEEINETAVNLRREGDLQGLRVPAAENGIDADDEEAFAAGALLYLCDDMAAAIGKIEIEAKGVDCAEIMEDWVEYIKVQCIDSPEVSVAVCVTVDMVSCFFSLGRNMMMSRMIKRIPSAAKMPVYINSFT